MGRRGNQRDARYGVACLGNHLVYLEARKLTAFARLGTLRHFYLYFVGIHQVFRCHAETSRGYLLDGTAQGSSVFTRSEAGTVFTTFTGVAAAVNLIHGDSHRLMGFLADGTVAHGTRHETVHDAFCRLYFINGYRTVAEIKEIS